MQHNSTMSVGPAHQLHCSSKHLSHIRTPAMLPASSGTQPSHIICNTDLTFGIMEGLMFQITIVFFEYSFDPLAYPVLLLRWTPLRMRHNLSKLASPCAARLAARIHPPLQFMGVVVITECRVCLLEIRQDVLGSVCDSDRGVGPFWTSVLPNTTRASHILRNRNFTTYGRLQMSSDVPDFLYYGS